MVFFFLWFSGSWRAFWYFYIEKQLFYSKKLLARVMFTRQRVGVIPTCYGWFFADGRFLLFFPFLLSLFQRKCTFVLFSLDLSISVFLFFYCFIVVLGLIIKVLVIFNLVLELQCHILLFFFNAVIILLVSNSFFLGSCVKILLIFNFILGLF